jgi:hypothetical protein
VSREIKEKDTCCDFGEFKCDEQVLVGRKMVYVDKCIADIVNALNHYGIETVASCCGHNKVTPSIALKDGRELKVFGNIHEEAGAND